jgi:hypothetical protein
MVTNICVGPGYDKVGRHYQNNQGLTKHIQYGQDKKDYLWSVQYWNIPWALHDSNEYIKAIDNISVYKSHDKVEFRIITAKLVVFLDQVIQQSLVPSCSFCSSVYWEKQHLYTDIVLF